jgi:Lon protease-like protein
MHDPTDTPDFSAVPLFPLPNVVLFPRAVLPLHIFEDRYRAMVADSLKGRRQIAMALLREGWEKNYHTRPAIDPVVCVGSILAHERMPDGRYNILLQGIARARVVRELGDQPFRVAELAALRDTSTMEIDLTDDRRRLQSVFEADYFSSTGIGRQFRELVGGQTATATLADLIAFTLLEDVKLKQSLLADCDVRRRVTRTVDAVESLHSLCQAAVPNHFAKDPSLN